MHRKLGWFAALLLVGALGCIRRDSVPTVPHDYPKDTPEAVLQSLEQAYQLGDTTGFRSLCAYDFWSHVFASPTTHAHADYLSVGDECGLLNARFKRGAMPAVHLIKIGSNPFTTQIGLEAVQIFFAAVVRFDTVEVVDSLAIVVQRPPRGPGWELTEWIGQSMGDLIQCLPDQQRVVDDSPLLVKAVPPKYPDEARQRHIQGKVVVSVLVGAEGKLAAIGIAQGVQGLDDAALEAVSQYVFKPALIHSRPVACWIAIPLNFKLSGS